MCYFTSYELSVGKAIQQMKRCYFKLTQERKLTKFITKQQPQFLGHCMRKDETEKMILMDKIEGKRARGRQRMAFLQTIAEWSGMSGIELIQYMENRNKWHKLVADVIRQGTRRRWAQTSENKLHILLIVAKIDILIC